MLGVCIVTVPQRAVDRLVLTSTRKMARMVRLATWSTCSATCLLGACFSSSLVPCAFPLDSLRFLWELLTCRPSGMPVCEEWSGWWFGAISTLPLFDNSCGWFSGTAKRILRIIQSLHNYIHRMLCSKSIFWWENLFPQKRVWLCPKVDSLEKHLVCHHEETEELMVIWSCGSRRCRRYNNKLYDAN